MDQEAGSLSEKRALQAAVALAGLVPVLAGLAGAADPGLLNLGANPQSATHAAYLSGLLLGIGLGFWSLIPRIETEGRIFMLLTGIVLLGGLARLALAVRLGIWTPWVTAPLVMELLVTPALYLWQRRLASSLSPPE
jgi:hypothetical protein